MSAVAASSLPLETTFWEETDLSKPSTKSIITLIQSISMNVGDYRFDFSNIAVTGEARASFRDGNIIGIFAFDITMDWTTRKGGILEPHIFGTITIEDFSSETLTNDAYLIIIKCDKEDSHSCFCRNHLLNIGVQQIHKTLRAFETTFSSMLDTLKYSQETFQIPSQNANASLLPQFPVDEITPMGLRNFTVSSRISAAKTPDFVWNEINLTQWSSDTLKSLFARKKSISFPQLQICLNFLISNVIGEASISIPTKSLEPLITFDFNIELEWRAQLSKNITGGDDAQLTGKASIPCFCDTDWDNCSIEILVDNESKFTYLNKLIQEFKAAAPIKIREHFLAVFYREIKNEAELRVMNAMRI
ncbi:hypothetical protein IE077_003972 [Cardiosporidium cionae]|uniref:Activator of Hsp90 ATPase AHSA1-like N-terminal domain-containing protein n=1 Tax=Cardiosporidium cionae TaxID=476202 RepID=A0ABQ7J745_9APIC|nr:hypothetical protein IE077_003972 [Cardiosporidium cionae]|eukprot:KAF8819799.1 hypothetical protein IE077_003972 [Cardiosporidium cionae]